MSLLQLLGALLAVESISRTIEARATLAADLLGADRLAGLIARVHASGGVQLATLLEGIDPDEAAIVDIVAAPIEAYLGLVAELSGALVCSLAFAEATVVDADFGAPRRRACRGGPAGLSESGLPRSAALIESAVPLLAPFLHDRRAGRRRGRGVRSGGGDPHLGSRRPSTASRPTPSRR